MVKRCGLVGSQRKAEGIKPSGPAKEPGGRDLVTKPIKGTRGRFGATGRRGRICGPSTGPGPLEKYLERGKVSKDTLRTNTAGALRRGQEEKAMTGREENTFHSVAQGERETKLEPSKEGKVGTRVQYPMENPSSIELRKPCPRQRVVKNPRGPEWKGGAPV